MREAMGEAEEQQRKKWKYESNGSAGKGRSSFIWCGRCCWLLDCGWCGSGAGCCCWLWRELGLSLVDGWLYVPGEDPSRVYYGTDTRAFSVLIGAALALALVRPGNRAEQPIVRRRL